MKTRFILTMLAATALGLGGSLAGCSDDDDDPPTNPRPDGGNDSGGGENDSGGGDTGGGGATFDDVYAIISANCTNTCHNESNPSGRLRMDGKERAHQNLVGKNAAGGRCGDAGTGGVGPILVSPGDPGNSLLVSKVEDTTPRCGARMPLSTPQNPRNPLGANDIATIKEWIQAGANL